jgi:energy-coupling factor transporter ATP-binding protein EcfA2
MQRVMVVGQPGAGKSTLARAMGEITKLPVVHIDHIHWQAGWIDRADPRVQNPPVPRGGGAREVDFRGRAFDDLDHAAGAG